MNRLARVVAKSNHSVVLELVQAEKCSGCPANCNKPLIDLFSLRKNLLSLSIRNPSYLLIDDNKLLSKSGLLGETIKLDIDVDDLVSSSAMMYLLPLLLCLIFSTMGHFLGLYFQIYVDMLAVIGFATGLLLFYLLTNKNKSQLHLKFRPKVTISSMGGT